MSRSAIPSRFLIPAMTFMAGIAIGPRVSFPTHETSVIREPDSRRKDTPSKNPRPARASSESADSVLAAILSTPSDDLLGVASGIGRMTALSDTEARKGHQTLESRPPRKDYVGCLVAAHLWSRAAAGHPGTPIPQGWNLDQYPDLAAQLSASGDPNRIREEILAGRTVSFEERRLFFIDGLRKDPAGTFGLWLKNFSGENQLDEMAWFHRLMEDSSHRATALQSLMNAGLAHGDVVSVIDRLSAAWMIKDPAGYEQWIGEPQLAPYRDSLLQLYAARRCQSDPANGWRLSAMLPENIRTAARLQGSRNLAETNPQLGIQHLSEITAPDARGPLVRAFGENLAIYHYDDWKKWRNSLPKEEQDAVNQSSFETWVARDATEALAWLQTRPDGPEKADMISETASRFAREHPEAVAGWIRTLPDRNARLGAAIAGIRSMPSDAYDDVRRLLDAAR